MSQDPAKSREDVKAAREAKKLAKQKAKQKGDGIQSSENIQQKDVKEKVAVQSPASSAVQEKPKSKDEVDRAVIEVASGVESEKSREQVISERAAKKAAKQAKKKGTEDVANKEMTVKEVVDTLKDIKNVAKDMQDLTAKTEKKPEEANEEQGKSKAELKAERRAKQEAQRAKKQAATEQKVETAKPEPKAKVNTGKSEEVVKEKSPKPKAKAPASGNIVNWFQHLQTEHNETLKKVPLNSNLHPAVVRLGVQLAARVVSGSNARCVALLDALKKMVKDFTLPARTEFARGFEPLLVTSLDYLWSMRPPCAAQTNAVKYLRHHLTQLPNNVDEFDAKKLLQEEIDKYVEDQIDKACEAISIAVQKKISDGDTILTYGCSSLVERVLVDAWRAGRRFRAVVVGERVRRGARELPRRLLAAAPGLPATYVDITALDYVMRTVTLVVLGASALLANGMVVGAAGSAAVCAAARARQVPVLVGCPAQRVSTRVVTDAVVYNELGDPDDLIDQTDENSPLKDWRTTPNLTLLNLMYDVTPPSLVTAVVTDKAILPCTSAPVVLRTKLEYGM